MSDNKDMFKMFLEAQQETAKIWQDMLEKTIQNKEDDMGMQGFFNPKEYFENMTEMSKKFYKAYTGEPKQLFAKLQESQKAYQNVYKAWLKLNEENFKPSVEFANKIYEEWNAQFSEQMKSNYLSYLPESMKTMVEESVSLMESYRQAAEKLWAPWFENKDEFFENFMTNTTYDPHAYLEFLKVWKENYKDTFSKLINIPTMGFNREFLDKQSDNFDKFIQFSTLISEVLAHIYKIGQDTMKKVIADYIELYNEGKSPRSFDDFYRFWAKEIGDALDTLYFSPDFSKLVGHTLKAMTELKKESDKLWEKYLEYLPIPKNSDMNSLYKSVYDLRKEVQALRKEVQALKQL